MITNVARSIIQGITIMFNLSMIPLLKTLQTVKSIYVTDKECYIVSHVYFSLKDSANLYLIAFIYYPFISAIIELIA